MSDFVLDHSRTPMSRIEGDVSFWTGTPEQIAETTIDYRRVDFHTFICGLPAPCDADTMESLMNVVRPMVEGIPLPARRSRWVTPSRLRT